MTHPALASLEDCRLALEKALNTAELSILERRIIQDMIDDLHQSADINTFADLVELANDRAKEGYY